MNFSSVLDKIGEWNPQLLRELKGRLKPRNIVVFSAISLCLQMLLYSFYQSLVPNYQYINNHFDRYCIGNPSPDWNGYEHYYDSNNFCLQDAFGNLTINWQLWWLDIFITTSIIAIFVLLVGVTVPTNSRFIQRRKSRNSQFHSSGSPICPQHFNWQNTRSSCLTLLGYNSGNSP